MSGARQERSLFGVFDGHGAFGKPIAQHCSWLLPNFADVALQEAQQVRLLPSVSPCGSRVQSSGLSVQQARCVLMPCGAFRVCAGHSGHLPSSRVAGTAAEPGAGACKLRRRPAQLQRNLQQDAAATAGRCWLCPPPQQGAGCCPGAAGAARTAGTVGVAHTAGTAGVCVHARPVHSAGLQSANALAAAWAASRPGGPAPAPAALPHHRCTVHRCILRACSDRVAAAGLSSPPTAALLAAGQQQCRGAHWDLEDPLTAACLAAEEGLQLPEAICSHLTTHPRPADSWGTWMLAAGQQQRGGRLGPGEMP